MLNYIHRFRHSDGIEGRHVSFMPVLGKAVSGISFLQRYFRRRFTEFPAHRAGTKLQRIHDRKKKINHPAELLDMLGTIGRDHRYHTIKNQIVKLSEKEDITMCQIAEELEQRGMQKGAEQCAERMRRLMAVLLEKKAVPGIGKSSGRRRVLRELDEKI